MILGFSHYNLRGPRPLLEVLRAFYTDVVGLDVGERPPFNNFGYWLYGGGRDLLHLSESRADEPKRVTDVATTFDHVAFSCAGLAEVEERLQGRGVAYRKAQVPLTGVTQLFFRDPCGNGVELNFSDEE